MLETGTRIVWNLCEQLRDVVLAVTVVLRTHRAKEADQTGGIEASIVAACVPDTLGVFPENGFLPSGRWLATESDGCGKPERNKVCEFHRLRASRLTK